MLAATLAVGVLFTLAPPQTFSDRIGSGLLAIVVLAAVGTLLQTPALFGDSSRPRPVVPGPRLGPRPSPTTSGTAWCRALRTLRCSRVFRPHVDKFRPTTTKRSV